MLCEAAKVHSTSASSVIRPYGHRGSGEKFSTEIADRIAIGRFVPSKAHHPRTRAFRVFLSFFRIGLDPCTPTLSTTSFLFGDMSVGTVFPVASFRSVEKLANLRVLILTVLFIAFSCHKPCAWFLYLIVTRSLWGLGAAILVFLFPFRVATTSAAVRTSASS